MDVTGQPVELGDNQPGFLLTAEGKGGGKLGPVVLAPALYLGKFGNDVASAFEVADNGGALGIQP